MPCSERSMREYSTLTGLIFLFNLIVGTGSLALPGAFQKSGFVLGLALLLVLAFFSFVTVTFVVEALSAVNALTTHHCEHEHQNLEETPLVHQECRGCNVFEIREKYEIGYMGVQVSPKWCQALIFFCLCAYLFGDLVIYAVVIGRCGSHIICSQKRNLSSLAPATDDMPCWDNYSISRINVYRLVVIAFILSMGPFVFFDLHKTKILQLTTSAFRWLAFLVMILWSTYKLTTEGPKGHPVFADFNSLPTLFGALVYSFMCQHSIPGILQPIRNKTHLNGIIGFDFVLVAFFYIALCLTGIFTFRVVQDIYTINFWEESIKPGTSFFLQVLAYLIGLFPIFTISTNFPIIAITLRNNIRNMFLKDAPFSWFFDRLIFPLLAIIPPIIVALIVSNVQFLVGVVGSYAGTGVQYLIPCLLVHYARSKTKHFHVTNIHASPFKSNFWIYAVYVWMIISLILITVQIIINT